MPYVEITGELISVTVAIGWFLTL